MAAPVGASPGGTGQAAPGRKVRVLLIAEACNPSWSSVPLVGYNLARALAGSEALEVTVVTHERNREALGDQPIGRDPARPVPVHFVNNEFLAGPAYRLGLKLRGGRALAWTVNMATAVPGYYAFEWLTYRRFRAELKAGTFDLVHRITPVSPVMPSPLVRWSGVPMVIGPVNGGLPWPLPFRSLAWREREWLSYARPLHRLLPYYRSTYARAAGVLVASRQAQVTVPGGSGPRLLLPENGVDPERFPIADRWTPPETPAGGGAPGRFRFITVGRLVPLKVVELILQAMARSDLLRGCHLTVVGDGPERANLEALTDALGLRPAVEFTGWLGQGAVSERLRGAQAFVFPSVREFGGGVVLEAMAAALPSVVTDYGGPGDLVTEETGIKLPMNDAGRLTTDLRAAMERLASDHALCARLGEAAARRVRTTFTWSAKAEAIVAFYRTVLRQRAAAPGV